MKIIFAIIFIVLLFALLNYYIGRRTLTFVKSYNFEINTIVFWSVFGLLSMSYIIAKFAERLLPDFIGNAINIIGGYWLAVMLYFIITILVIDIFRMINRRANFAKYIGINSKNSDSVSGIIVFIILAMILAFGTYNGRHSVVRNYDISISKDAKNISELNIVMVSDIHIGSVIHNGRVTSMVDQINSCKPDIVLLAGDIIDGNMDSFINESMWKTFSKIKAPLGVYAVPGNHDYISGNTSDLINEFNKAGIKTLVDEKVKVADSFYIIGRNDLSSESNSHKKRRSLEELLKGVDKNLPLIIMDHQPYHLEEAESNGIDIQFSGHTHRGQLFPNDLITKKIYELDWGYLKKSQLYAFVSSGFGTWGPPIRIGSRSEIVNIKVSFNNK